MIKAVFFDLDDTLCDSDTAWHIAVRETFQLLCKRVPGVSEEAFTEAWTKVHQELFQQLNAGKRSMAEVRDSRFQCVFKELGLPISKITEELNDFLSTRYIASLHLYEDVAVLEELHAYHIGIITNGAHDKHTDSQFSKVRHLGSVNVFNRSQFRTKSVSENRTLKYSRWLASVLVFYRKMPCLLVIPLKMTSLVPTVQV